MIQLNCIKCGATLSIDDAFAGGVCRCQHCGAIQKVPTPRRARPAMPGSIPTVAGSAPPPLPPAPPATRSGNEAPPPPEYAGSVAPQPPEAEPAEAAPPADDHLTRADLNHLAEAAAVSSGLRSTKLKKTSAPTPVQVEEGTPVVDYATPQPAGSSKGLIIAIVAVVVVLLLAVLVFVVFRPVSHLSNMPASPNGDGGGTGGGQGGIENIASSYNKGLDPALTLTIPNFLGVPLNGSTVIYVIDRGQGTVETFDGLRGAIMRSLSTLGPETKFQLIFWETSDERLYPTSGPDRASSENKKQAGKVVADAIAFGASKIEKPLEKALAGKPDEICIATGKFGLDQAWADEVKKLMLGKGVKVHTFAFGRSDSAAVLKSISEATGGTFRDIDLATANKLADFAPTSGN
ncbi:MAG: hypothetical protein ABSH20_02035 [Tepidisphaeraceae bacterium]|jgi:hypothetical protein